MIRYLVRRLILAAVVLWAALTLTFLVLRAGGDPITADMMASGATPEQVQQVLHDLGYDRPLVVQYVSFLGDLLRGDLGTSLRYKTDNAELIATRAPFTLYLGLDALIFAAVFAVVFGLISARRPGGVVDRTISGATSLMLATPSFVVGLLLIMVLSVNLKWLPVSGAAQPTAVILPAITLAMAPAARFVRVLRASLIEVSHAEYIVTAKAKGVPGYLISMRHLLRNALLPFVTLMGLQVSALVGGAVVVESVFGWPGIGTLARDALTGKDYTLVQAIVVVTATTVVVVNIVTDLLYRVIDPRIQLR